MKIVLCCAGGFSTTMLMDSMKRVVKESKKLDENDFEFNHKPDGKNNQILLRACIRFRVFHKDSQRVRSNMDRILFK